MHCSKKLNTLHQQLAALEQEHVDVNSLSTVRTELIHTSLLLHKDRGVKAYTACCLADILRLYAPEAPYTQHELRDIFQFFFRQLSAGFKGQDEPYYTEYFHLIESLSTVKSVVLVCDLPSADELLAEIFRDLFTIAKRDFTRKVELYMADILIALIDECNSLPSDVLEVIMAQFIDKTVVGLFLRGSAFLSPLFLSANPTLIISAAKRPTRISIGGSSLQWSIRQTPTPRLPVLRGPPYL
jgi:sister-chromatid-cohesion protein PDS5